MKTNLSKNLIRLIILTMLLLGVVYSCKEDEELIKPAVKENLKSNGTGELYYGHEVFTRMQGSPITETRSISNIDFQYFTDSFIIYIANGVQGENMVSSAVIKINGIEIAGPEDFSQNAGLITKSITNLTQDATLEVEVRGSPGGIIDLWIEGELLPGYSYVTAAGGIFTATEESVIMSVQPDALNGYGILYVGHIGNEPTSVPNPDLQVIGAPITIRIPSDSILKPLTLTFTQPTEGLNYDNYSIFAFDGTTYFPLFYQFNGDNVVVSIDTINWNPDGLKSSENCEIIIYGLEMWQSPSPISMGLKEIDFINGEPDYKPPAEENQNSKIALFVHGWIGAPSVWNEMLPAIQNANLGYTKFWSFGYNSGLSINSNALMLKLFIEQYGNGAKIDIIAHSMGGLVSRSLIEVLDGSGLIDRLVTIGTPHKGSPLAALRYLLGALISIEEPDCSNTYSINSQGPADMVPGSTFINFMKSSNPPFTYYTIACNNNFLIFNYCPNSRVILGNDDGVVSVNSARGAPGSESPSELVQITQCLAHMHMTRDEEIQQQVINYLSSNSLSSDLIATGISNESIIRSVITDAGYEIQDVTFSQINSSLLNNKSVLALFNGGQTWNGNQIFTTSQADDIVEFVEDGGVLYITSRNGYSNILSELGVNTTGSDGGSSGFDWPIIQKSAAVFYSHPITAGLYGISGDVGAGFTYDSNWALLGETYLGIDLLAVRNYGQGKVVLWYAQRSHRNPGQTGNVYETDINKGNNRKFYENLFEYFKTVD